MGKMNEENRKQKDIMCVWNKMPCLSNQAYKPPKTDTLVARKGLSSK